MPAADDFVQIIEQIRRDSPAAARRVAQEVFAALPSLNKFPHRGRIGVVENTRELVLAPWPFIAVYQVLANEVQILRIRHSAREWP